MQSGSGASPDKPALKVRRGEETESVHGALVKLHSEHVADLPMLGPEPRLSAIRTRAPGGPRAPEHGAGGSGGDGQESVGSEEAVGGANDAPAAAGAEEAGLTLCDCCDSPVAAAELVTEMCSRPRCGLPQALLPHLLCFLFLELSLIHI